VKSFWPRICRSFFKIVRTLWGKHINGNPEERGLERSLENLLGLACSYLNINRTIKAAWVQNVGELLQSRFC
jgi:hypothetical protein